MTLPIITADQRLADPVSCLGADHLPLQPSRDQAAGRPGDAAARAGRMIMTATACAPERPRFWRPRRCLCAVCTRPAAGFGFFDPRSRIRPRPRRWFCSMTCQGFYARKAHKGLTMIDFTEEETQALPAVMRALAPEMERIGWDRPLGQLTQNDMHRLIVTTIEAFRAEMAEIASQSEIPF